MRFHQRRRHPPPAVRGQHADAGDGAGRHASAAGHGRVDEELRGVADAPVAVPCRDATTTRPSSVVNAPTTRRRGGGNMQRRRDRVRRGVGTRRASWRRTSIAITAPSGTRPRARSRRSSRRSWRRCRSPTTLALVEAARPRVVVEHPQHGGGEALGLEPLLDVLHQSVGGTRTPADRGGGRTPRPRRDP